MPTVLRERGYRFFFFSHEPNEPPHIHVDGANGSAKFWLNPPGLARSAGFGASELNKLLYLVRDNRTLFEEAWHGYFGTQR